MKDEKGIKLLGVMLSVFAIVCLLIAFHYIDIAHNMYNLGVPLDIGGFGQTLTALEIYQLGICGFFGSIFLNLLGLSLLMVEEELKKDIEKA